MNIPDLIDGFITWQSPLPCHANQDTLFVDKWVLQNRGVCRQAFPFLPSPPPSRTFLRSPQFSHIQKAIDVSNLRKARLKRLLRRLFYRCLNQKAKTVRCRVFKSQVHFLHPIVLAFCSSIVERN